MRVYLDDLRPIPEDYDVLVKNAKACIQILRSGRVKHISLDHDLSLAHYHTDWEMGIGPDGRPATIEDTGYAVACWIESAARAGYIPRLTWAIHTQQPVGGSARTRMEQAMRNADKAWDIWETGGGETCYCDDEPCMRTVPVVFYEEHNKMCHP